jgi:hypothetical protein
MRAAGFTRRNLRLAAALGLGLVVFGVLFRVESQRRAVHATRATIATVMQATEAFRADHDGRCPGALAELVAPSDGHEPYLPRNPRDGWGREFHFRCPGRKHPSSADVISGGPSGTFEDTDQVE